MSNNQNVIYNKFYGGIAEDSFVDAGNQVYVARNCNFNSGKSINTNNALVTKFTTGSKDMYGFIYLYNGASGVRYMIAYGAGGEVYNDYYATNNTPTFKISSTSFGLQAITNAVEFEDSVYFTTNQTGVGNLKLQKMLTADVYYNWRGTTISPTEFTSSTAYSSSLPTPVLFNDADNYLYIGYGKTLITQEKGGVAAFTERTTLKSNIVYIGYNSGYIKIFCENGDVVFWNRNTLTIDDIKNIGVGIKNAKILNGIDYILTINSYLGYLNGGTLEYLNLRQGFNRLGIYNKKLLLSNDNRIFTFGKDKVRLGDILENNIYITTKNFLKSSETYNNILYIVYYDQTALTWGVATLTPGNGTNVGTVNLREYTAGASTNKKTIKEVRIFGRGTFTLDLVIDGVTQNVFTNQTVNGRLQWTLFNESFFQLQPIITFSGRMDELQIIHTNDEQSGK